MYLKIDELNSLEDIPDYNNFQKPYIIRGGCKSMKIFTLEDKLQFLKNKMGNTEILTEIYVTVDYYMGRDGRDACRKVLNFSDAYDRIMENKQPYHYVAEFSINKGFENRQDMLSYFDIDTNMKRLHIDTQLFFGNKSYTGAHIHVLDDYVLNQVYGSKTVYMFDYNDNQLETNDLFTDSSNFLKDNFFTLDHSKLKIYKVVVNEGDSLTIPPWWWHAVKSDDIVLTITKTYKRSSLLYLLTKPHLMGNAAIIYYAKLLDKPKHITILFFIIIIIVSYVFLK